MDDLIIAAVLIIVVIGGGTLAITSALSWRTKTLGRSAPSPGASPRVAAEQAKVSYHLAQRAVRILDRLVDDEMTRVVIPTSVQAEIKTISKEFYDL